MASVVVDGLVVPISVAGHPALDFCNTRAGWGGPRPKEYLHTHAHLTVWARENGLVAGARGRRAAPRRRARPGRGRRGRGPGGGVPRRAARGAARAGRGDRDWARVNREVRRAGAAASALRPGPPADVVVRRRPGPSPCSRSSGRRRRCSPRRRRGRVAACPGTGCGWIFADPRGRRRWCSMAWCGNRAKARRHATTAPSKTPAT